MINLPQQSQEPETSPTEGRGERREEAPPSPPPPPKSIRQLLDEYKAELQGEAAETEATKQFTKDLNDLAKEYDGVSAIVAKYRMAHQKFIEQMKPPARIQHDEVQSWCNDLGQIPENVRAALRSLRGTYAQRAEAIKGARGTATTAFNGLKSRLDKAKAAEADALAASERTEAFEATANGWFTDLTGLHKSAKGYLDVRNYRLVYAYLLEVEDVWRRIRGLDEALDGASGKTPDWLLHKLNQDLRALISAKRERYLAHKEWLAKERAVTIARINYKYFIEDDNRRKDFLREAQDIEPAQLESGADQPGGASVAGAGTRREAARDTESEGSSGTEGSGKAGTGPSNGKLAAASPRPCTSEPASEQSLAAAAAA